MWPGPVFNVELLTTARRARYFAARALYGAVVLLLLWSVYSNYDRSGPGAGVLSIARVTQFSRDILIGLGVAQVGAVLLMTPVLVAGVIADESQRKTLHYLLASRLSGGEIVAGKLAARLLHVVVYLAIGLPIIALLSLLGGIDPAVVGLMDAATATTAYVLAAVSILVSVHTRRVRDAILATYLIGAAWVVGPTIVDELTRYDLRSLRPFVAPINDWFGSVSPLSLAVAVETPRGRAGRNVPAIVATYCALQVVVGSLLIALAIARLRRVHARSGERPRKPSRAERRRLRRADRRPPIGDDPMLWKETQLGRSRGLLRVVVRVVGGVVLLGIAAMTLRVGAEAYGDLIHLGYVYGSLQRDAVNFNEFIRVMASFLYVAAGLGVATAAATSITSEREGDTWAALTASDLSGPEIVYSKMAGAAWSLRHLVLAIVVLWIVGLPTGSIHPLGLVLALGTLAAFLWFAAALGVVVSLRSRTTTRAMAVTLVILAISNVGYLIPISVVRGMSPLIASGCSPFALYFSQFSTADLWGLLGYGRPGRTFVEPEPLAFLAVPFASAAVYGLAAARLGQVAVRDFALQADRPRRPVAPRATRAGRRGAKAPAMAEATR